MKKILMIFLLVVFSFTLAACNSSSKETSSEDTVEIDFFHRWPNEPRKTFYDEKIKEFEEENPNIKINVNSVLNDSYKEKIKVQVSSNELPDVFSSWSDSFAKDLVSSDRIMALDDIIDEDKEWSDKIIDSQFSGFTFDDTTYGIPFTVDGKAFFYNTDVFEDNNIEPPKTYEEFITVLDELQDAGYDTPLVEGLTDQWAISHYLGSIFERIIDPEVIEKDYGKENREFTDPGYEEGLKVFQNLTGYMGDVSTAMDHEEARNMFSNGEAPIIYMQFAEIKMVEDIGQIDFDFFDFPEFEDGKGNQDSLTGAPEGWMLSEDAPSEAIEFLKFLTSEETAFEFTKEDGQLNAIQGAVNEENSSKASVRAYDLINNASSTAPWFDNAVDMNIADVFMKGGQSLATNETNPGDIMKLVHEEIGN